VVSAANSHGRSSPFSRLDPLLFHSSSFSIVLTRLSGPRSRPPCIVLYFISVASIFLLEHRASVKHRFNLVSYSRTVGRTAWNSDQPIARPLPNTNTE
jgi:hypothetical protein